MYSNSLNKIFGVALVLFLSILVGLAAAHSESGQHRVVEGVEIYLGMMPTGMIYGYPKDHPESLMHGGIPTGPGNYHVVVALFDGKTGQRISGAEVKARVAEAGFPGEEKKLDPMFIADTVTYGNFFKMPGAGPYQIVVQIRLPNAGRTIEARFEHKHI